MDVLDWLLDADPSIRWQVMRDLTAASDNEVTAERSRVAREGWGARLLDLQGTDGQWGGGTYNPKWYSTHYTMMQLLDLGIDPLDPKVQEAVALVRDNVRFQWSETDSSPFFEGETEDCINGMVLAMGTYFGQAGERLVQRLLDRQLDDGGWNCEAPPSVVTSIDTSISVLEGLLAYENALGGDTALTDARERCHQYFFDRRMFKSLSSGEVIDPNWTKFSFPTRWPYDVLRGLDYLRNAGVDPIDETAPAIDLVESQRDPSGRWVLEDPYSGEYHFTYEEVGEASRWITLRALRVLAWAGR